jgi:hypothetical protein
MAKKMKFLLYLANVSFTVRVENLPDRSHMNVVGMCGMILVILIPKKQNMRL